MDSIDIFPWDENFNTGLPAIDEQHRKLVQLINLLASHVAFNADLPHLNQVFNELSDYAVYHFQTEEAIWHEYLPNDPVELKHQATHEEFVHTVLALKAKQGLKPISEIAEEALGFLTTWLASHILETDRAMAYLVIGLKEGLSPDKAKERAKQQMSGATRTLINIILAIYGTLSSNTLQLMREIAERKRNEAVLIEARKLAEEASRAKSRFLANMSHELRTPLNGILGMGQLLQMPDVSDDERIEYATTVIQSGQALLGTLNSLLEFASIDTGSVTLQSTPFSPVSVIQSACTKYREAAHGKGLRLEENIAVPGSWICSGDGQRIHQMVEILLSNAIKFTRTGTVTAGLVAIAQSEDVATLEFSVADTGIGIPREIQSKLFQPFVQADNSTTRPFDGAGVGLSIMRHLAEMMDGQVGVDSVEGKGSRFWFRIRLARSLQPA